MAVGLSDGTSYTDSADWFAASVDNRTDKQRSDQTEINQNSMSGDFESRFGATYASTMPPQASTELAGALKQTGSTRVPGNGEKVKRDTSQDIYVNPWVTITPEDIDTGINIGLSAGPGTMVGIRSINNLTGAAKNEALSNLGHAQVLEANGVHPDDIVKQTGFARGSEGRWKTELDDSVSKFDSTWHERVEGPDGTVFDKGTKTSSLEDVLDHPELYKAIPALKDIKVIRDSGYPAGGAAYEKGSGPGGLAGAQIRMGTSAAEDPGILLHEVQHAIQEYEGFAKGGAPRSDVRYLDYTPDVKALKPEMQDILKKAEDPEAIWTTKDIERGKYLAEVGRKYKEYTEAAYAQALEYYHRLAGEVESRNVDTRLLLTAEERKRMLPAWTEDTPRSRQIVRDEATSTTAYGIVDKGKYIKP